MKAFLPPLNPSFKHRPRCVATIGIFDGLHAGHKHILARVIKQAGKSDLKSLLVSLYPHPLSFYGQDFPGYITTQKEKVDLLKGAGLDYLWVMPFNKRIAGMKGIEFLEHLLKYFRIERIVVAKDFRFGHRAKDKVEALEDFCGRKGIALSEIEKKKRAKTVVSSSLIRSLIRTSFFKSAAKFLGRPYSFKGEVIRGKGIGKKILGTPTINLDVDKKIAPALGVYISKTKYKGRFYPSVSLLGVSPTFKRAKVVLETNIFDFNKKIYGQSVEVVFIKRLRSEKRFSSADLLKAQIIKDIDCAKSFFSRRKINHLP